MTCIGSEEGEGDHSGCGHVQGPVTGVSDSHGKGFGLWPKCSRKSITGFQREENDQIWMLEISL